MKKYVIGMMGLVAMAALALDNTIQNDFWDTTAYENGVVSEKTSASATLKVDTCLQDVEVSGVVMMFSTRKPGLCIIVR